MPGRSDTLDGVKHRVLITGTGRTGTSFLVQLLTVLGFDTGYTAEQAKSALTKSPAHAGLEGEELAAHHDSYVQKSPYFCRCLGDFFCRNKSTVDLLIVPMRELYEAAESRRHQGRRRGGLTSKTPAGQEDVLLRDIYELMYSVADYHVPMALLRFPRLVRDPEYLYRKLAPILAGITFKQFRMAFYETAKPEWVHKFKKPDKEK